MATKDLKIKVCGLNNQENIEKIDQLGVDYIGLIFYQKSPRFAGHRVLKLKGINAKKVGVFVNASLAEIKEMSLKYQLDVAQLHGKETPSFCEQVQTLGLKVWKVFGIDNEFDFDALNNYKAVSLFLFDTKSPIHGGTGIKFNWDKLRNLSPDIDFMLSGGINASDAGNINQLDLSGMRGIDLNSRFEIEPGLKDIKLLKKFIGEVQN